VPSVIRLLAYRHIPQQSRALSRKNILLRDRNTASSAGVSFPVGTDARSCCSALARRPFVLENLVACCYRCNNSKGDQRRKKRVQVGASASPVYAYILRVQLMRRIGPSGERWRKYYFTSILPRSFSSKLFSAKGNLFCRIHLTQ